nr:hypothetical protein GUARANI_12 [Guarani virophage]
MEIFTELSKEELKESIDKISDTLSEEHKTLLNLCLENLLKQNEQLKQNYNLLKKNSEINNNSSEKIYGSKIRELNMETNRLNYEVEDLKVENKQLKKILTLKSKLCDEKLNKINDIKKMNQKIFELEKEHADIELRINETNNEINSIFDIDNYNSDIEC